MDRELFNRIVNLLVPHMGDRSSRQALLSRAMFGSPVLNQLSYDGNSQSFTVQMITTLERYGTLSDGTPALVAVLQTVREQVGTNHHAEIDALIKELQPGADADEHTFSDDIGSAVAQEDRDAVFETLRKIGTFAEVELAQQWAASNANYADVPLYDETALRQHMENFIPDIVRERGVKPTRQALELINGRLDLIERARKSNTYDQQDYDEGRFTREMLENRRERRKSDIAGHMDTIEKDLLTIGIRITRGT